MSPVGDVQHAAPTVAASSGVAPAGAASSTRWASVGSALTGPFLVDGGCGGSVVCDDGPLWAAFDGVEHCREPGFAFSLRPPLMVSAQCFQVRGRFVRDLASELDQDLAVPVIQVELPAQGPDEAWETAEARRDVLVLTNS